MSALSFDADLLNRYDRPGPRYTSYPTAPQFDPSFSESARLDQIRASNEDPIPRSLSIYLHIPYCTSPCFYCGCNRVITRQQSLGEVYAERLMGEMSRAAPYFDEDRDVVQLHLGGGTPNFLSPATIGALIGRLRERFHFSDRKDRDFSIELDPRFVTPDEIGQLAALGFNRASLGVQDFDPVVQAAVNRLQSVESTLAIIDACRRNGLRSINVDLIYGLPKQSLEGFGRTLDVVIAARPDRLAIYGYAHLPEIFKPQRQIDANDLPSAAQKLALLQLAIERLGAAGYEYIGMDHFALPHDELAIAQANGSLHRNFMGYTTHASTDLLGLGVSAISRVGDSYWQNHRDVAGWSLALDNDHDPLWRGLTLSDDDLVREDVIQQLMCLGIVDVAQIEQRHRIDFDAYFATSLDQLRALASDGLVDLLPGSIRVTPRGRLLLRVIAMCFDAYLDRGGAAQQTPRYSRAI